MTPPQPWFWPQSQTSYGRMYTMMGSIDFATKLKITPQTLIPGFGNFYRAALLNCYGMPDKGPINFALGPPSGFFQTSFDQ